MAKLTELAERCEQATGEDKIALVDLEAAIRRECGAPTTPSDLPYVTSLDAAMTLVPEGWHISWLSQDRYTQAPMLSLARNGDNSGMCAPCEKAATPALALCAAALRARTQNTPDSERGES